jgi:hypothetical protein
VLLRICFSADLPPLHELLNNLEQQPLTHTVAPFLTPRSTASSNLAHAVSVDTMAVAQTDTAPVALKIIEPQNYTLPDLMALCRTAGEPLLAADLAHNCRVVKLQAGRLDMMLTAGAAKDFVQKLRGVLTQQTGQNWLVGVSALQAGAALPPTWAETEKAQKLQKIAALEQHPTIKAWREKLPSFTITNLTETAT